MIKTFLAPYETYLWAALAFLLLVGSIVVVHKIKQEGVNQQLAADAKLAQAQLIHKDEVEKRAQEIVSANDQQLHAALVAPAPIPGIVVRVCPSAPTARFKLPANGGAVSGSNSGPAPIPAAVGDGSESSGLDIAPSTEQLLARADAEIAYWRKYYSTCKAQGICK
jgi:heme exporter protein D